MAELINKALVFFYTAYLARTILTNGIGAIGFAQAATAYLAILFSFGLDNYGIREVSKNKSLLKVYVDNIISIRFFFSIL